MTAIYKATFNTYTNSQKNNISCFKDEDRRYETVHDGSLLITEYEFEYYKHFGNGFKTLEFVGYLRPYAKVHDFEEGEK